MVPCKVTLEDRFRQLLDGDEPPSVGDLAALYDASEPIDFAFLLGEWNGGTFGHGHPLEPYLASIGWAGKAFRAPDDVDPIVCFAENGDRVANAAAGTAHLELCVDRGSQTVSMVYDSRPMRDHFRRISDRIVVGVMEEEGGRGPLYFYLARI